MACRPSLERYLRYIGSRALLLAICGISLGWAPGSASAARHDTLPVQISARIADVQADVGIRVDVASRSKTRCNLIARSGESRVVFRSLLTDSRGRAAWRWAAADRAPAGTWAFKSRCSSGRGAGSDTYRALVFTSNLDDRRGDLIGPSTSEIKAGRPAKAFELPHRPQARISGGPRARVANPFERAGYRGQCTWYAWSRRPDLGNATLGNAHTWADSARRAGFPVNATPAAGAIAVWRPYFAGTRGPGHVAYVERVLADGRILISEYNWRPLSYGTRIISPAGLQFIHRKGGAPPAPAPPATPPFAASLDAQFGADQRSKIYAVAGGPSIGFGWNIRFNQRFHSANFVARPDTPSSINRFSAIKGDFPAAVAPNDDRVGYYRGAVQVPAGTPSGTYLLRWSIINRASGQNGGLMPSFSLIVVPRTTPPPGGDGAGGTAAKCAVPAPGGPFELSRDHSFDATLDTQFPMDSQAKVYATPGATVPFGYNIRFNQTHRPDAFALRTDTPGTINFFSDTKGDWYGATPSNDNRVGYYRANVVVPPCTPAGEYQLKWNMIDMRTGKFAGFQPSFVLVVLPPATPPDGGPSNPGETPGGGADNSGGSPGGGSSGPVSCPVPDAGGPLQLTRDYAFGASVDAQFPMDASAKVYIGRGGTVPVGYNIRWSKTFRPESFVLRADTPGRINYFSDNDGDWAGTTPPNDDKVGYFRANFTVPACTPPGDYFVRWAAIDRSSGKWSGLMPSFWVVVQ